MPPIPRRIAFPVGIFVFTCFAVFYLPFLLPPPVLAGVSASNAAAFNNKISALAAALLGASVFFAELRWPSKIRVTEPINEGPLSKSLVLSISSLAAAIAAAVSKLIVLSHSRNLADSGYFIEQMNAHAEFGRKLYDQIEFPYGPILFYGPILIKRILSPLHLPMTAAYFTTLVIEQFLGLLMVAYIINHLPMLRRWKVFVFLLCVPEAMMLNFGLNYTFFRFALAAAIMVFTTRRISAVSAATCLFVGQMICLGISPEMGFAFAVAGSFYSFYMFLASGRVWLVGVAAPVIATFAFLALTGGGYFRMLKLFAHGVYNVVVEPLPYILIFLFALIWLVPRMLALFFRERRPAAPLLASLYILVVMLLPVALGRADPGHVFYNGFVLLLISMVAISSWKPRRQIVWAACVGCSFLWAAYIDTRPFAGQFRAVVHYDILRYGSKSLKQVTYKLTERFSPSLASNFDHSALDEDETFDLQKLESIIGNAKVATPDAIPLSVEDSLKQSGQYTPSIYCFHTAVLDVSAETREIQEFNQSTWALLPKDAGFLMYETPENTAGYLGFTLPYHARRPPYVAGLLFHQNLQSHWQPYATFDGYTLFKRKSASAESHVPGSGS